MSTATLDRKYEQLLKECADQIEAEFQELTESYDNFALYPMKGLDKGYCLREDACRTAWYGFDDPNLVGKCLPYRTDSCIKNMCRVNHMLCTDPVIQGAISKLVNYVVGPKGHDYVVTCRPLKPVQGRPRDGKASQAIVRTLAAVEAGVNWTKEHVSLGSKKGWGALQKESFRRKIRGEYFRTLTEVDDHIEVRFIEPHVIEHPAAWRDVQNIPIEFADARPTDVPPGRFGVLTAPGDAAAELGYFERQINPDDPEKPFYFHSAEETQHAKMIADCNDERGIGLFYHAYIYIRMARKIMDSLFKISQIQAKYAAIWTFAETARIGKIQRAGQVVAKDNEIPEEISPGEHMGKGWELDLPSTKIRTAQWTAIIAQLLQFAGAMADIPDWMMSSHSTAGRSNAVASEGPFDVTAQSHQADLNEHDIPLLWMGVAAFNEWNDADLAYAQSVVQITHRSATVASRDFHRHVQAVVQMVENRVMAREEGAVLLGANVKKLQEQLEQEARDEKARQAADARNRNPPSRDSSEV